MKFVKKVFLIFSIIIIFSSNIGHASVRLNSKNRKVTFDEALSTSKKYQSLGKFHSAIKGYNSILKSEAPRHIKNEILVYKKLAEVKKPISTKYRYCPNFIQLVSKSKEEYKLNGYSVELSHYYSPYKCYFDCEKNNDENCDDFKLDANNIPMRKYNGKFCYNPVSVELYALSMYGKYINGNDTKKSFLNCADFLINYMDKRGALKYNFAYNHYEDLKPGWTSSMAQGQALSVFERAFKVTGDKKYVEAGNKALKYLITPVSEGGVMDTLEALDTNLKNKIFFQEYVNTNSSYTLNGYIFTLMGLYDWWHVKEAQNKYYSNVAYEYFNKGIDSLKCILPYYDIGGFTSYDLYYITNNSNPNSAGYYHSVHVKQLDTIYYITKDKYFKDMRDLWNSYVTLI
ncbi:hypothetical protein CLRAG_03790 [Clostridium ragsdalei P11]|uniref:D-glucuronyl C5-epimerase C-terminal domain-containing protein n=1 Tax=Clostridium ragsdalei P11 TaxID=1353534 RepID=A0A1A6B2F2_9CLOT|nr:D-glucuronyl C5-epimerase family protein [Clostridium ragsdalei]OBR96509.1 hypothetical protein CLRAG_03790 [Clostridium ragsdalei P11]